MRKLLIACCVLISLAIPRLSLAYIEKTDNILSEKDNSIYIIGWALNRIENITAGSKEYKYSIYKVNLIDNSKTIFYDPDKIAIDRLKLSPANKYIAVTRGKTYPMKEILIIDKKLKKVFQAISVPDGIITYVWSHDSKKIAYMTGTIGEWGKINSKGIFVYNLETKEKKKIAETARSIEWLPTGELCLYSRQVEQKGNRRFPSYKTMIYDDVGGAIEEEKKGIFLSQDGTYSTEPKYYLLPEDQITKKIVVDFFNLKKGSKISGVSLDKVFSEPIEIAWGGDILWLKGNKLVVERRIKNSLSYDISIADIENNSVLKEFRGRIMGVNSDRSKLVIYEDGKFRSEQVP